MAQDAIMQQKVLDTGSDTHFAEMKWICDFVLVEAERPVLVPLKMGMMVELGCEPSSRYYHWNSATGHVREVNYETAQWLVSVKCKLARFRDGTTNRGYYQEKAQRFEYRIDDAMMC